MCRGSPTTAGWRSDRSRTCPGSRTSPPTCGRSSRNGSRPRARSHRRRPGTIRSKPSGPTARHGARPTRRSSASIAAAAMPVIRTSPARSIAPCRSTRPHRSPASSAAPRSPSSRARSRHERPALRGAAADRGRHGPAGRGAPGGDRLRNPPRTDGGRRAGAHARQHRVGAVLRHLRSRRGDPCADRHPHGAHRMVAAETPQRRRGRNRHRPAAARARLARGCGRGAAMNRARLHHRTNLLWLAALVHRLSGLALAVFLPLHFWALGLAIDSEARFGHFLRWTDAWSVKLAETGLVFLLAVHLLGGLRVLVIENFAWRDGQKQLATLAAGISAVVAFVFLLRAL